MLSANVVFASALGYVALLFVVAFVSDRRARQGRPGWLHSPITYTLSISVYCTSWTFYGAVGSAARNGLEFVTIYLGPTLVFVGWWFFLRKLVRIGQLYRITSIADMISSRFGKSAWIAALVTLIAVMASTPYIALQLKAMTSSFQVISGFGPDALQGIPTSRPNFQIAFWIAVGLAIFTILFGTRNIDVNERHHGVVAAIAIEAVVKLAALMTVGLVVVYGIADGPADVFTRMPEGMLHSDQVFGARWVALLFLAGAAIVCLPRQFQVTVVEASDERHLRTASWMFPLYMLLMSLFVLPIAISGLVHLPHGANPDMFVLTLPMWAEQHGVALFAFLGGFSSATSMVIVACIALSTMVSNHIVLPIALHLPWIPLRASGEMRRFLLATRRTSICLILAFAFGYFRLSGRFDNLASIGLIAFAGVAQLLPCLVGGLFWRRATARGALAGLLAGAALWAYTLLLPSFKVDTLFTSGLAQGPWGLALLRPDALFGLTGLDPLVHAIFWSLSANIILFVIVSTLGEPRPLEHLQSSLFVDVYRNRGIDTSRFVQRSAASYDLNVLAQRLIGVDEARHLLAQGSHGATDLDPHYPMADDALITELERKLAGSVGAATARSMVSQVVTGETISLNELLRIADDTQRMRDTNATLERQSRQLADNAIELRAANERLRQLDVQKDDFLSHVSHEIRTPMTSIRSFSEILLDTPDPDAAQVRRFMGIIHQESLRMTRLLDGVLELSVLERSESAYVLRPTDPQAVLASAMAVCEGLAGTRALTLTNQNDAPGTMVMTDPDRLIQVFINLISNAIKYNTNALPWVRVVSERAEGGLSITVEDNGPGIPAGDRERIFQRYSRGSQFGATTQGAGLGLAISWQIMQRLGGTLTLLDGGIGRVGGASFRVTLAAGATDGR